MNFRSLFFKQSVQKRLDNSHWNYSVLYLEFHVRNAAHRCEYGNNILHR